MVSLDGYFMYLDLVLAAYVFYQIVTFVCHFVGQDVAAVLWCEDDVL